MKGRGLPGPNASTRPLPQYTAAWLLALYTRTSSRSCHLAQRRVDSFLPYGTDSRRLTPARLATNASTQPTFVTPVTNHASIKLRAPIVISSACCLHDPTAHRSSNCLVAGLRPAAPSTPALRITPVQRGSSSSGTNERHDHVSDTQTLTHNLWYDWYPGPRIRAEITNIYCASLTMPSSADARFQCLRVKLPIQPGSQTTNNIAQMLCPSSSVPSLLL